MGTQLSPKKGHNIPTFWLMSIVGFVAKRSTISATVELL